MFNKALLTFFYFYCLKIIIFHILLNKFQNYTKRFFRQKIKYRKIFIEKIFKVMIKY